MISCTEVPGATSAAPSGKTFTPAPWELHSGYLIRKCEGDFCFPIAELRPPYRAGVGLVRGHYEEWHNGHLIAAAPKLYDKLKDVLPRNVCLTNANVRDDEIVVLECSMGELRSISALLAEARGEEQ